MIVLTTYWVDFFVTKAQRHKVLKGILADVLFLFFEPYKDIRGHIRMAWREGIKSLGQRQRVTAGWFCANAVTR